jgi:beta-galactosidase
VDETDLAFENGYPGPLERVLGISVEEIDALYEAQTNTIVMSDGSGVYPCRRLADLLHTEGAEVLATYGGDFYAGMPVVTRNRFGAGEAYYIGSDADDAFLSAFYTRIARQRGIAPALAVPEGVEIAVRSKNGSSILFVLNHNTQAVTISLGDSRYRNLLSGEDVQGELALAAYDVAILKA